MDPSDQSLSLDEFSTWKIEALRGYLSARGLSTKGTKAELSALCFAAQKINIPKIPSNFEILEQNIKDYRNILCVDGIVLKDPLETAEGWIDETNGITCWPPVFCSDIVKFFMSNANSETTQKYLNEYKVGKAYEYFKSNWLKEVFYKKVDDKLCVMRARCTPSQRVKNEHHSVWVCVAQETGEVKRAYCSCTAGLGQTCNHVAGILFRVEAANRLGITVCTSVPCTWTIPSADPKLIPPAKIKDMKVEKSRYGKIGKSRSLVSSAKTAFEPIDALDPLKTLSTALREVIPNACLFRGLDIQPIQTEVNKKTNTTLSTLSCNVDKFRMDEISLNFKVNHPESDSVDIFLDSIPMISKEEICSINLITTEQSNNTLWKDLRKGRITASNFYSVYTRYNTFSRNPQTDISSLLSKLMGYQNINENVRSLKYGRETEPVAKQEYLKLYNLKHHNVVSEDCGLFIDENNVYLAASPDMLISCSCCGDGLLEVKCPMIPKCDTCINFCMCSTPEYLNVLKDTNTLELKKFTSYYGQIQGQMAITGRKWCDFFVYSVNGVFLQRIMFDEPFYKPVHSNIVKFYKQFVVPELITHSLRDQMKNDEISPDREEEPMETDSINFTYFCPVCRRKIEDEENVKNLSDQSVCCDKCDNWFHFKCVKQTKSSLSKAGTWFCQSCLEHTIC